MSLIQGTGGGLGGAGAPGGALGGAGAVFSHTINQSLRFHGGNDATYLSKTWSTDADSNKIFTFSCWFKRSDLGNSGIENFISSVNTAAATGQGSTHFGLYNNDKLAYYTENGGENAYTTNIVLRDPSAWYHVVYQYDTTQTQDEDRLRVYLNGQLIDQGSANWTSAGFGFPETPALNSTMTSMNQNGRLNAIGAGINSSVNRYYFSGCMAEVIMLDGVSEDYTAFAEFSGGVLVPKEYSGSYGTNGYRLTFEGKGTATTAQGTTAKTNIGDDQSGNGNNWAVNLLEAHDVILDSPTNSFAVMNPLVKRGNATSLFGTFSEGNLKVRDTTNDYSQAIATHGVQTGKYYYECYINEAGFPSWQIGWLVANMNGLNNVELPTNAGSANAEQKSFSGLGYFTGNDLYISDWGEGSVYSQQIAYSGAHSAGDAPTAGDIIGVAADFDNRKFYFHINGEYIDVGAGTGNPSTGANPSSTYTASEAPDANHKFPWIQAYGTASYVFNFGQDDTFAGNKTSGTAAASDDDGIGEFYYAVPTGFKAICATQMADITVGPGQDNQADDFFDTILYSGSDFTDLHIGAGGARHPQDTITIANSLKFDDGSSPELYKSWLQDATDRKHFTVAFWIKRSTLGTQQTMLQCDTSGGQATQIIFDTSDKLRFNVAASGVAQRRLVTTREFNNISSFYHIVCAYDSEASTASERARIYVNGVEETAFDIDERSNISGTDVHGIMENGQSVNTIGFRDHNNTSKNFLDGYLCDYHCIDGQTLGPESFGQVGANGDWIPKTYSGSYGNNGFRLTFQTAAYPEYDYQTSDRSTTNDFTKAGLASTDQTIDSPTQNFSTLDSKRYSNIGAFSEGNLTITTSANQTAAYGTIAVPSSGKWYYEVHADNYVSSAGSYFGWGTDVNLGDNENGLTKAIAFSNYNEQVLLNGTGQSGGYGVTTNDIGADGDVFSILLDVDNGLFYYAKNGTYFNSANPSNGTGGLGVGATLAEAVTAVHPMIARGGSSAETYTFNFGQDASFNGQKTAPGTDKTDSNGVGKFLYDVPTGFLALMDDNIPQDGVTSPDLVWIKKRSGTTSHYLFDTVRGAGKDLHSDDDPGEASSVETLKSFDSQGFTVGLTTDINDKDTTYVAWTWKAGGPAPTQTYAVTVVEDGGQKYYRFDGNSTNSIALTLQQGGTYTFDQSDSSNAVGGVHPLRFSTTSDGTHGGGSEYTVGVTTTGTPGTTGAKTVITVAWGAPTLYYYCTQHSGMGGQVNTIETRGSSNLKGSIPSIVSANQDSGFSIVKYTGTGSAATIGHGLSNAPEFIIVKNLDDGTKNWNVYPTLLGNNYLELNNTNSTFSGSTYFNNTAPTANVFSVGSAGSTNAGSDDFIAYCFHSVEGYCKVGAYQGNGSNAPSGVFVYTGFRPALVMVKASSDNGSWVVVDNKRPSNFNGTGLRLVWDDTSQDIAYATSRHINLYSNGFEVHGNSASSNPNRINQSAAYIFLAFAEAPFKFANAR